MSDFVQKVKAHFKIKLPFVIYSKPNSLTLKGILQKTNTLFQIADFQEKGFVMVSFDGKKQVLLPENESEIITSETIFFDVNDTQLDSTYPFEAKENFENLVRKGIQAIDQNQLSKVVLSRTEAVKVSDFDLYSTFEKIVNTYPTAFCYCFFHPEIGLWLGASPEQLLKVNDTQFQTTALAGTQQFLDKEAIVWENKEKEEQQIVTDFILENLKNITSDIAVSNPYTYKAGNVLHIKTDIEGSLEADFGLKQVLAVLHPTPAVCGLPKETAKAFILENEGYDRKFYSGFLGELNLEHTTDLYVNLRCMEIEIVSKSEKETAHLYMGCGITKDSIPENEFIETVNKSLTMKKIINKQT